jgi:hypothetical protein
MRIQSTLSKARGTSPTVVGATRDPIGRPLQFRGDDPVLPVNA